jgi:HAMP domain-containing protein
MSGCEAGILVVPYVVVLATAEFFISRRIVRKLVRIERLLASIAEKNIGDTNNVGGSKDEKERGI